MNKDDIILMAREAGINVERGFLLRFMGVEDDLERFAALVAAAEREACAKVCEAGIDMWPNEYHEEWNDACENRAAAIRTRGQA